MPTRSLRCHVLYLRRIICGHDEKPFLENRKFTAPVEDKQRGNKRLLLACCEWLTGVIAAMPGPRSHQTPFRG